MFRWRHRHTWTLYAHKRIHPCDGYDGFYCWDCQLLRPFTREELAVAQAYRTIGKDCERAYPQRKKSQTEQEPSQ